MKSLSIRTQIILLVLALVSVALVSLAFLTTNQLIGQLHDSLERKAKSLSDIMSESVGPGLEFQDSSFVADVVRGAFADEDVVGLCICGPGDVAVYRVLHDDVPPHLIDACPPADTVVVLHEANLCIATAPIMFRDQLVGDIWIAVSQESMYNQVYSSVSAMLIGSVLVLGLILFVGSWLSRRIVRPIRLFEAASERIREGDMVSSIEVPIVHKDFLSLGRAFNAMQKALRSAFEQVQSRTKELQNELAERRKTEEALQFTQFSVDHAAEPSFWMDSNARLVYVNEAACQSLGYSREELISKTLHDIDPNYPIEVWEQHWSDIKKHRSFTLETFHRAKDGRDIPVEVTVNFMEYMGKEYNCAFARDISERKKAEQQEGELREKLDRAERMESLGILAGGVAHDLNNMLGPLVGYPELILMRLPEDSPVRKQVKRMGSSARDAADVVQDLLTLARRGRYEMQPTDLNHVVRDYIESPGFAQLTQRRQEISLDVNLTDQAATISGSAPHLAKVIMNLIVNAYDAISDGGELAIQTEVQRLSRLVSGHDRIVAGNYVLLRVRDTGTGISEADLPKIFEPYYSRKKMDSSGSGLGLSVVYGVVKDHNGYYDVLSKEGEGTEFILYFPISEDTVLVGGSDRKVGGGSETILIVDDSPEQRQLASDMLSSLGYNVVEAEHGTAAVRYMNDHSADLIVLDMIMEPGFDGLDTYSEITRTHPGQKAIIVSGFSATDRVERAQLLGAGLYVKKPYTRAALAQAVRGELDRVPSAPTAD
ncbi:MAG: response regulator [candidate division Zixibacteria bacterium]|nr:response regulator [candidate division Zixibacteria bacterium]MDH4032437.1 response regulator [candidate division Zixibacteria bacterium]